MRFSRVGLFLLAVMLLPGLVVPLPAAANHCTNRPGAMMWWVLAQGGFVAPPTELTPKSNWTLYTHPSFLISFLHPPTWRTLTAATANVTGVRVGRPAGGAALDLFFFTDTRVTTPQQAAAFGLAGLLGNNVPYTTVCGRNWVIPGAIPTPVSMSLVVSGQTMAGIVALTFQGLPGWFYYTAAMGPEREFVNLILTVYAPITEQLRKGVTDDTNDRDGDGVPDSRDNYPDDPHRH